MTITARSWLFILAGVSIALWARWIDPCAWRNGSCPGHVSLLMIIALILTVFVGVRPLIGRWLWVALKCKENDFKMRRWRRQFDGPFGEVFEWLMGMDRDGNLRSLSYIEGFNPKEPP